MANKNSKRVCSTWGKASIILQEGTLRIQCLLCADHWTSPVTSAFISLGSQCCLVLATVLGVAFKRSWKRVETLLQRCQRVCILSSGTSHLHPLREDEDNLVWLQKDLERPALLWRAQHLCLVLERTLREFQTWITPDQYIGAISHIHACL